MAEYIAFAPNVEVNGETILSFVNAMPEYSDMMQNILNNHHLTDIKSGIWYSQQKWLDSFKEIAEVFGKNTLFMIGKAIPESAQFPPDIDTLEKALASIDLVFTTKMA